MHDVPPVATDAHLPGDHPSRAGDGAAKRFVANRVALAAFLFLVLVMTVAVVPGAVAPHDPDAQVLADRLQRPGTDYLLGTDDVGRDQLSRLLYGTRTSVGAASIAVAVGFVLGVPAGLVSGFVRGRTDAVLRSIFDGLMSIPGIVFAVAVIAALGPGLVNAMCAIGVVLAPRFYRIQRASTIATRDETYIEACHSVGCTRWRTLWRHVLPNTLSATLGQVSIMFGVAIIVEASLSFIGLGAQPPTPSWGSLMSDAFQNMDSAPHLVLPAGIAITLTVLAFSFVGDGVRDAISRRSSAR